MLHEYRFTGSNTPEKISRNKLMDFSGARAIMQNLRNNGITVVYIDGVFDLLHGGHLEYVEAAAKAGDFLAVGVKPDLLVRANKGENRPLRNQNERACLIAALGAVDAAFILPEQDTSYPEWRDKVLSHLNPSIYAIMEADEYLVEKEACVSRLTNTSLVKLRGTPKTQSTTNIIKKIQSGF